MYSCIYCGNIIKEVSKEHIILASFGSNFFSKNLICKNCNNSFSTKKNDNIDKVLSEQFDSFKLLLNIKNPRGKQPPSQKKAFKKNGLDYDLCPNYEIKQNKTK